MSQINTKQTKRNSSRKPKENEETNYTELGMELLTFVPPTDGYFLILQQTQRLPLFNRLSHVSCMVIVACMGSVCQGRSYRISRVSCSPKNFWEENKYFLYHTLYGNMKIERVNICLGCPQHLPSHASKKRSGA